MTHLTIFISALLILIATTLLSIYLPQPLLILIGIAIAIAFIVTLSYSSFRFILNKIF